MASNKVAFIGAEGVGKTSLIDRFRNACFSENSNASTIGANYNSVIVDLPYDFLVDEGTPLLYPKGLQVRLGLWDVSGNRRYKSMVEIYLKNAEVVVLCYDEVPSLKVIKSDIDKYHLTDFRALIVAITKVDRTITKDDVDRLKNADYISQLIEVKYSQNQDYQNLRNFCNDLGLKLYLTSSKCNCNVDELFTKIGEMCYKLTGNSGMDNITTKKIKKSSSGVCCPIV